MKLTLVAAVAENRVIGSHNALPWYIPEDLKHFKRVTDGKVVLMGRETYESIIAKLGKPLPNRKNVVVSRSPDFHPAEGVDVYVSIEGAIFTLKDIEVMVIGGGQVYNETIKYANKLILTEVHKEVDGDVLFPVVDKTVWKEILREDHLPEFSFVEYERK